MKIFVVFETIFFISVLTAPQINPNSLAKVSRCIRSSEILQPNSDPEIDDEYGENFEGDMILSKAQLELIENPNLRNGLISVTKRWPNKTVTFHIEEDQFDDDETEKIKTAMEIISNSTCIQFRPRTENEHAVIIKNLAKGCYSNVGYLGSKVDEEDNDNKQVLNLSSKCFKKLGTIIHEMLHTIGFYHMQSTYDRDDFIQIVWENIESGKEGNFKKYSDETVSNFGVPYDYSSIMHYSQYAFSKNKNATIIPLKATDKIGQRAALSEGDILKINKMYCN